MRQLQHVDNAADEQVRDAADMRSWRWGRGVGAALLSAVVVGVPTDVIDTDWFTRMTPVRWWEYPALVLTVLLTGLWFAIVPQVANARGRTRVLGSSLLSAFAVGCPVCNKLVIGVLGVSGALGVWAPIQPVLAVISLSALLVAVVIRWRGRMCATGGCRPT
ncbi:hypothetical protein [Saccharomonospora cyanea]|uniref:Uncharacterized protein n=1 Tax=Saccharomonospora cyanea NA-134 TaxID=882082 RepID=H5XDL5_9PSEU|nr:hypothetical protein [Saccharomonospora cyanea]EHR61336.1 hypothetical protein SaccyDRAFT_2465 [Saccharomonospora cyanea NA-134]